jgi:Amino acid permease
VFSSIIGPAAGLLTIVICGALFINMTAATADAGRALYGIARDGIIVRQLCHLNKQHVPARAMTIDLIVNLCLVFFVANTLGILFASNLGYMIAIVFALTGFLLLRRDRPAWPRPIRLGPAWLAIAAGLIIFNLTLIVVGALNPATAGYGGIADQLVGLAILASAPVMFALRRLVQDRAPLRLREVTPRLPEEVSAEQAFTQGVARQESPAPAPSRCQPTAYPADHRQRTQIGLRLGRSRRRINGENRYSSDRSRSAGAQHRAALRPARPRRRGDRPGSSRLTGLRPRRRIVQVGAAGPGTHGARPAQHREGKAF